MFDMLVGTATIVSGIAAAVMVFLVLADRLKGRPGSQEKPK
jgi:hypothetical protein